MYIKDRAAVLEQESTGLSLRGALVARRGEVRK